MSKPRIPRLTRKPVPKELTTPIVAYGLSEADEEAMSNEKRKLVYEYYEIPLDRDDRLEQLVRKLLPEVFSGMEVKRRHAPGGRKPEVEWHDVLFRDFEAFEDTYRAEHPGEERSVTVEQYLKDRNLGYEQGSFENILRSAKERRDPIKHWMNRQIPASLDGLKRYQAKVSPKYEQRVLIYAGDTHTDRRPWKKLGIPEEVVITLIKGRLIKRGDDDRLTLTPMGLVRLRVLLFGARPSKR